MNISVCCYLTNLTAIIWNQHLLGHQLMWWCTRMLYLIWQFHQTVRFKKPVFFRPKISPQKLFVKTKMSHKYIISQVHPYLSRIATKTYLEVYRNSEASEWAADIGLIPFPLNSIWSMPTVRLVRHHFCNIRRGTLKTTYNLHLLRNM